MDLKKRNNPGKDQNKVISAFNYSRCCYERKYLIDLKNLPLQAF